jgi:hypothetical protein
MRYPYTKPQLESLLLALEARYSRAQSGPEGRELLDAIHGLKDRLAMRVQS